MEKQSIGISYGLSNEAKFFPGYYLNQHDRVAASTRSNSYKLSPSVIKALQQNNPNANKLLAKLQSGAATVLTGQQIGFGGGPLLTLFKAITAIKTAQELETESGIPHVPIFWLQTEDHDFAEIARAYYLNNTEIKYTELQVNGTTTDSVGKLQLSGYSKIEDTDLNTVIAKHYQPERSLALAFQGCLQTIVGEDKILFFDPRTTFISAIMKPIIDKAITHYAEINRLLSERAAFLDYSGYQIQIPIQPNSTLLFHSHNSKRERLPGGVVPSDNADISPSALFRPLIQDYLFGSAAYIGGQAEISYWAQIKPLYDFFGLAMPILIPRDSYTIIPHALNRQLELADVVVQKNGEVIANRQSQIIQKLSAIESEIIEELGALKTNSPKYKELLDKTATSIAVNLSKLTERVKAKELEKDSTLQELLAETKNLVKPLKKDQERVLNTVYMSTRLGIERLMSYLITISKPFSVRQPAPQHIVI